MRNGLSAGPLPANLHLPFAVEIQRACLVAPTFSPLVAYAIKVNETNLSTDPAEIQLGADPATLLMPDGSNAGRSPFQLTSSWPDNWKDPYTAALYAIQNPGFLYSAEVFWADHGLVGYDLVRAIAASYNAGIGGAAEGHARGNIDLYTTKNYGARALKHYQNLEKGITP